MKTLSKTIFAIFIVATFISCEKETTVVTETTESNFSLSIEKQKDLEKLILNMVSQSEANGKISYVEFNFSEDNIKNVEISFSTVTKSQFDTSSNGLENPVSQNRGNLITITCTFPDGTSDSVTCTSGDFECIGVAVQGCVNSGGCAETCKQVITYIPKYFK